MPDATKEWIAKYTAARILRLRAGNDLTLEQIQRSRRQIALPKDLLKLQIQQFGIQNHRKNKGALDLNRVHASMILRLWIRSRKNGNHGQTGSLPPRGFWNEVSPFRIKNEFAGVGPFEKDRHRVLHDVTICECRCIYERSCATQIKFVEPTRVLDILRNTCRSR